MAPPPSGLPSRLGDGGIAFVTFDADWLSRLAATHADRRLAPALMVYAAIAMMIANVSMYASSRPRAQIRIPETWRNIEQRRTVHCASSL